MRWTEIPRRWLDVIINPGKAFAEAGADPSPGAFALNLLLGGLLVAVLSIFAIGFFGFFAF